MFIYTYRNQEVECSQCLGWLGGWAIVTSEFNGMALIPPWNIVNFNELWRLN